MTPKQQYKLALSSIRHLRRINRNRAEITHAGIATWRINSIVSRQQEILRYSVEHHIMSAAVTTIISMKFNDYRFMSNRVLDQLKETRVSMSKIQLGILDQLTYKPHDVAEFAIADIEYLEAHGFIEYVGYEGIAIRITSKGLDTIPF